MLLVAFSRRMCCSRVDSVSTKLRRPSASTVSPARRPGIWRTNSGARREQADIGAAEVQRIADRLAFADGDVGAHLTGRARQRRAQPASVKTAISRAPRACAASAIGRQVARIAEEVGRSARPRSSSRRRSRRRCPRSPSGRAPGGRFHRPPYARGSRRRRHIADAGRRRAPPLRRVSRWAISIASPHAVEPSYIEALATSMPVSARDLGLELEQDLQRALRDLRLIGRVAGEEFANAGSGDRRVAGIWCR